MIDLAEVARAAIAGRLRRYPAAHRLARRLLRVPDLHKDDAGYVQGVYRLFAPYCAGGRTLEIGPGSNLGVSVLLARDGCEAVAVDLVDQRAPKAEALYAALVGLPVAVAAGVVDADRAEPASSPAVPPVRYVLGAVERLPFASGSFDYVFSNACFEHFRDPAAAASEIARILRPGGRTVHEIDLRDHRHLEDAPLRFLRYGDRAWSLMSPPGPGHMNRWRMSQYVRAFEATGLRVAATPGRRATAAQLAGLRAAAPRFRRLDAADAETLSCLLVAERPRAGE